MNKALIVKLLDRMNHPLDPPGSFGGHIAHPRDRKRSVEIGVVIQHRFAFGYWAKWSSEMLSPPNLLTIDWHDDVGGDCDFLPDELKALDIRDENELNLFCWGGLRSVNDGHIAPARYLNLIGDTYVILKQKKRERKRHEHYRVQTPKDMHSNTHQIYFFDDAEQFLAAHGMDAVSPCIWDLDLDYFVQHRGRDFPIQGNQKLVSDEDIRKVLDPKGGLMRWIRPRLAGLTIALEPEYCGGIRNCMHILDVVGSTLCDPPLLSRGMKWRR